MEAENADLERQLELERQSGSGQGLNKIDAHYEYVKKRKWVDTSKKERVWVEERIEGDRRIEGHYQDRNVPSGYWQEYEEKVWIPNTTNKILMFLVIITNPIFPLKRLKVGFVIWFCIKVLIYTTHFVPVNVTVEVPP